MLFLSYLRRRVSEAVLGGVADAASVLGVSDDKAPGADPDALRKVLADALAVKALAPPAAVAVTPAPEPEPDDKKKSRK